MKPNLNWNTKNLDKTLYYPEGGDNGSGTPQNAPTQSTAQINTSPEEDKYQKQLDELKAQNRITEIKRQIELEKAKADQNNPLTQIAQKQENDILITKQPRISKTQEFNQRLLENACEYTKNVRKTVQKPELNYTYTDQSFRDIHEKTVNDIDWEGITLNIQQIKK